MSTEKRLISAPLPQWHSVHPSQASHRQRRSARVQGRGGRVGAVPEWPRGVCSELLPGQGGGSSPWRCCSQDLPQRLHQGSDPAHQTDAGVWRQSSLSALNSADWAAARGGDLLLNTHTHTLWWLSCPVRCSTFVSATDRCSSRRPQLRRRPRLRRPPWPETYQDPAPWEGSLPLLVRYATCLKCRLGRTRGRSFELTCPLVPLRSVGSGGHRRWRPSEAVHPQDEFCQGLGTGLPPPKHQGDPLLDRDPPAQSPAVTGRGSAHDAHRRPAAAGLRLFRLQHHCNHGNWKPS